MPTRKLKIALLFCGGSSIIIDDKVVSVEKESDAELWFEAIPELELIADIDPIFIYGGDSSEIEPGLWQRLAREINVRINQYDGFVVTHGIDTIMYTAAMQSQMLQNLTKPIIFTGSPLSHETEEDDDLSGLISNYKTLGVKANLINAVQVAIMDIAEVAIMFGNRLIRATDVIKSDGVSFNVFDSATKDGLLGKVDFGIKLFKHVQKRKKQNVLLKAAVEERICLFQLAPGVQAAQLQAMIDQGCKGIMVRSLNANLFPKSFDRILSEGYAKGIPIVAHNPFAQESKKKKREYILVNDQTFETTFVKFMWSLGQTKDLGKIRMLMWDKSL